MNTNEIWDSAGLAELDNIEADIRKEMKDKTTWFKLSAAERMARQNMITAIHQVKKETEETEKALARGEAQ